MGAHTPGPWSYHPYVPPAGGFVGFVAGNNGHHVICEVSHHDGIVDAANARLIAAAPDMLEALKAAQAHLTATRTESDSARTIAVGLAVDYAIAKAESE